MRWFFSIFSLTLCVVYGIPCMKWRETKNCQSTGVRNPSRDASCSTEISGQRSGYCECANRVRAHAVDCDHHTFTCDKVCEVDESANLDLPEDYTHVTCGSTLKLVDEDSRFRLHSHEINYGSGSGQQSITAHGSKNDPNSYWLVKEGHGEKACRLGDPIQCGSSIRLEHVVTRRNLHSHNYRSPITRNDEVSAFGVVGDGDEGDTWIVECEELQQCDADKKCEDDGLWKRYELIRLRHAHTQKYLQTGTKARFDDSNCPHCPINGQQEVSAAKTASEFNLWFAAEGIYISSKV